MNRDEKLEILKATINQIKINNPGLRKQLINLISIGSGKEEQTETIRRLKIQNKKLLEQVESLRQRLKKSNLEKTKILKRLNNLKKINNSLSERLGFYTKNG